MDRTAYNTLEYQQTSCCNEYEHPYKKTPRGIPIIILVVGERFKFPLPRSETYYR